MPDTLNNIDIPVNQWVDIYLLSGITVGTQLAIENVGVADIYLAVQETEPDPDHDAFNIVKRDSDIPYSNSVGDSGAWAFAPSEGGKLNVSEV